MKKYFGPGFLLLSILLAFLMMLNKPSAKADQKKINVPYVKTMLLFPQTVSAQISSQGFVKPKSELNVLSQLNTRVEWVSEKMQEGSSFNLGDTLIRLDRRDYELALITAEANVLNAEVNLDGDTLRSEASAEKEQLISQLREDLEAASRKNMMEADSEESTRLQEKLQKVPLPIFVG